MPSCYAVGAKKALIYRAYRTQNRGSKEKIPYPSKSAFYCATNLKQRSDEASGIGENKLRELMDNGELEYVQNGNRRLIADTAIWDWYERAKNAVKPPAEQGG